MKNNKIINRALSLTLLFFFACSGTENQIVLDAVPKDAALVLEAKQPQHLHDLLYSYSETMDVAQELVSQLDRVDSLFASDAKWHERFLDSHSAFVVSSIKGKLEYSFIFCFDKQLSSNSLKSLIESKTFNYEMQSISDLNYMKLLDLDSLYCFSKSHFVAFSSNELMMLALSQQIDCAEKVYSNADFNRVCSTLGDYIPVYLYLNYNKLNDIICSFASSGCKDRLQHFSESFHGFAALDVLSKSDALVMNGFSVPTDSASFLCPLRNQIPVHNSVIDVLPYNTKMMLHFGLKDYVSYWSEFADFDKVAKLNKRLNSDISEQLVGYLSEVSISAIGPSARPVFIARMSYPSQVMEFMNQMDQSFSVIENIVNQGYAVKRLNVRSFVPDVFGSTFSEIKSFSYSIVDQYLVIANDIRDVQDVIFCYRSGRTLDLSENFRAFQENMVESANVTLYVACADNQNLINKYVGGDLAAFLKRNSAFLPSFHAFSLQLSSASDLIYTCFCLRDASNLEEESDVLWKVGLDAPMYGSPYLVHDPATNSEQMVFFDDHNSMYLVDCHGKLLWKKQFAERLLGELKVIDYEKDGNQQFLFNDGSYIYLVDQDGNDVEGFPKSLICKASNGLCVMDCGGSRNYRVLVCGVDKFLYNYDLRNVEEADDWNRHRTDDLVTQPVPHVLSDGKDFFIVTDVNGIVRVLDRHGRICIPVKADMRTSQGADFYENRTNHKGVILTSDEAGNLLYIANDGSLARTEFGQFSDKHFFLYEDFDGDQDPDFIYLDDNKLRVFNRFKKVLYSHDFDTEITTKPKFFGISGNKRLLVVVSENAREVYLIDKDGNMIVNSGLVGEKGFAVASLKGNNEINLLVGVGSSLHNYLIY